MQHDNSDLKFVELGRWPRQRSWAPRATGRLTKSIQLRPGVDRPATAQAAIDDLVEPWGLPQYRARRWLSAAEVVLNGPTAVEMYMQLDCSTNLFTLELWAYGRVVFGIDDWLGV